MSANDSMGKTATTETAAALIIGNELLSGKVADANTVVLAKTLQRCGVRLCRVVMVLDDMDVMVKEIRELSSAHDVLFTSGGVGPTHDDLTIDAVAKAFDLGVEMSADKLAMLETIYGDAMKEGHKRMARVPEGARLVTTSHMPWPTTVVNNVWVLPGVPEIFATKMPVVLSELAGTPITSLATFTNLDEGQLKPFLDVVVAAHPAIEVGSYPKWRDPGYRTKVTFDGKDEAAVRAARDAFDASLPADAIVPAPG